MSDLTTEPEPDDAALLRSRVRDRRSVPQERAELRFVFVGRVSTDEERNLQDPTVSKAWQRNRAEQAIEGKGTIVREVFDQTSRTIPWMRRPNAAAMLREIQNRTHDFDAIVVGETKRMFSGSQLEDVFYLVNPAGVDIWLPDIGRYDHNSLHHRISLMMEGIFGRVESETVRGRVRDGMTSIAMSNDPRWLGGTPPYGYKLVQMPAGHTSRSAKGYTNTLAEDPDKGPVVRLIFASFLAGKSFRQISALLKEKGIKTPAGKDVWTTSTISTLLGNMNYTGHRQWGKQRKEYVPFDEQDHRLGTIMKRSRYATPPVVSEAKVHPALVSVDDFVKVQELLDLKRSRGLSQERTRTSASLIPLRGRVYCAGRRMEADVLKKSGNARFRLRADRIAGVTGATVSERALEATVHAWFADTFSRKQLPTIRQRLKERSPALQNEIEQLERRRSTLARQMENLISNMEEVRDPALMERYSARRAEANQLDERIELLRGQDVDSDLALEVFEQVGREMRQVLAKTRPELLAKLYERLNLRLDYDANASTVTISISPVGGRKSVAPPTPDVDESGVGGAKGSAPGGSRTLPPPSQAPLFELIDCVPLKLTA